MDAWRALLGKELRLNRSLILGGALVAACVGGLAVVLAYHSQAGSAVLAALMGLHAAYLAAYMLVSLTRDWELTSHLWLHSPQSGRTLLSAKLVSGILSMLAPVALLSLFALWTTAVEIQRIDEPWPVILQYGFVWVLLVAALALYTGVWATTLWVVVTAPRAVPRGLRVLLATTGLLAASVGTVAVRSAPAYTLIVRWGAVHLPLRPIQYDVPGLGLIQPLYVGECLFCAAVLAALLYCAGRLLDRHAEV